MEKGRTYRGRIWVYGKNAIQSGSGGSLVLRTAVMQRMLGKPGALYQGGSGIPSVGGATP